jgi:hypothetical protein
MGSVWLLPLQPFFSRLSSKKALETACFMARELSMPQVQPGHSRRTIATAWLGKYKPGIFRSALLFRLW